MTLKKLIKNTENMFIFLWRRIYLLSPTSRRPIRHFNRLDEIRFNKFRIDLESERQLNSTMMNGPESTLSGRQKNILPEDKPGTSKSQQNESDISESQKSQMKVINIDSVQEDGELTHSTVDDIDDDCICIESRSEAIEIIDNSDCDSYSDTDEVIVVDDTTLPASNQSTKTTPKKAVGDESVIFISESLPDYIPLVTNNPLKIVQEPEQIPKKRAIRDSLFSNSEKKQLEAYNVNAYNPNSIAEREERQYNPKRMVIIDGSNVAFAHSRKQIFSVKGIQICVAYFKKMGHEVKVVIPLFRLHKMKSTDPSMLEKMHRDGIIVVTPCKALPGLNATSYDDRFILQLAAELDAAIVSNDNYRDLIDENTAFKKLIENRVIGYTWCDDVFMLPKDPYGKFGPTLHSILNRQIPENNL